MRFELYLGVAATLAFLWFMWQLRGRIPDWLGAEYLRWNRTPCRKLVSAVVWGLAAGVALAWTFRNYDRSAPLAFVTVWSAIMFGPFQEEIVFRGYLFSGVERLLKRWSSRAGWLTVIVIAAVFAVSHLIKAGITPRQIASVFLTGTLYGWLRLDSNSTVPPVLAHMSYNAVILLASVL
jgi:membrane protease YdiL (CAAX protease family)